MEKAVIIVARESQLVSFLKEKLASCYELYAVDNYDAGITLYCEKAPYAVIVEDIIKLQSGIELCRRVRQDDMNTHIILLLHEELINKNEAKIRSGADYVLSYTQEKDLCEDILTLPVFQCSQKKDTHSTAEYSKDESLGQDKYVAEDAALVSMGEYRLIRKIAEGGMADIYLALKKGISGFRKLLVLKLINKIFCRSEDFVKRFMDEAKICAHLSHKNIVQVYDHGSYNGQLYIAMEYVRGTNLAHLIQAVQAHAIPPPIALYIAQEMCYGLSYAHNAVDDKDRSLHIVHRDLSPHNILISANGEVKIADFGVAKATITHHHTGQKSLIGKILYMSPEQIENRASPLSDMYSVGVMMYEMLTAEHPFVSGEYSRSPLEILKAVSQGVYRPIPVFSKNVTELESIILKALSRDARKRYHSAEALLDDLLSLPWAAHQNFLKEYIKQCGVMLT